jgi:hypothetical protein
MAFPSITETKNNSEVEYFKHYIVPEKLDQRISNLKILASPIFTYDELEEELNKSFKKINELEDKLFKLKYENQILKEKIETISKNS